MTETAHSSMHRDHTLWASEISLWRDHLRAWQHELSAAQAELLQLQQPLQDHAHTLRTHASALRLYEQEFEGHEHALSDFEKGSTGQNLVQLARRHSLEADHQAQQRKVHEQLTRHHHLVMVHWNLLLKTLRQPLEEPPFPHTPAMSASS